MKTTPLPHLDDLKRQLAQLDALIAQGTLTGRAAKSERERLERAVLDAVLRPDADRPIAADAARAAPSRTLWLAIAAFVLVFGAAGYTWRGNFAGLAVAPGQPAKMAEAGGAGQHSVDAAQIDALLKRLAEHLKAQPDDAQGWAMLGRSYVARGRVAEALPALRRVVELRPRDAQALADYADGLALANGGSFDGEPERVVKRALELDPNQPKALALSGTIAFDRADFAGAAAIWERAVAASDPADDFARQLRDAIVEARARANAPAGAGAATVVAAATSGAASGPGAAPSAVITGRVSIGAGLASKVAPDDTVFIYAQAPSGSRMPLAILRKKAGQLPLDFVLDDSLAMSPAARLSSADKVVISARISKSGTAAPQPGDLQGRSAVVPVGARDVRIEIGNVTN
jgi:cytochrome c-type biogenesis protein CcmH